MLQSREDLIQVLLIYLQDGRPHVHLRCESTGLKLSLLLDRAQR